MDAMSFLHTKQELAAIWLNKPLETSEGLWRRLAPGAMVRVESESLVDLKGLFPTHLVTKCYGTMYNDFEVELEDLKTHEKITIRL